MEYKRDSMRLPTHTARMNGINAEAIGIDARKAVCPNRKSTGKTMAKTSNSARNPPTNMRRHRSGVDFIFAGF